MVKLAPPISGVTGTPPASRTHANITGLLKTPMFQSILVTHFHHLEKEEGADDDEYGGLPPLNNHPEEGEEDEIITKTRSFKNNSIATSPYECKDSTTTTTANCNNLPPTTKTISTKRKGGGKVDRDARSEQQQGRNTEEHGDGEVEPFDPPWPTEHEAFCALPLVQEHVLLEIAAGRNAVGSTVKPMEVPKGRVRVVLPGSLRERGEFCLVDVAFMKDPYSPYSSPGSSSHNNQDYRWRVRRTRFQTLTDYV